MAYMPVTSKEELRVPHDVSATAYEVELAVVLKALGEPDDDDYHVAAWDGSDAVLLIGAGSPVELAAGEYVVWTRVTAGTERPVRRAGALTVGTP